MKTSQDAILKHYQERQPKDFIQIDAFLPCHEDSLMTPDEDGDWICWGLTTELMHGSHARVLLPMDADTEAAARQLRKMAGIIEREGPRMISDNTIPGDIRSVKESLDALSIKPELAGELGNRLSLLADILDDVITRMKDTSTAIAADAPF